MKVRLSRMESRSFLSLLSEGLKLLETRRLWRKRQVIKMFTDNSRKEERFSRKEERFSRKEERFSRKEERGKRKENTLSTESC